MVLLIICANLSYAQCIPCSELPNDHSSLDAYRTGPDDASGNPTLRCWAHPHPNGSDYVITPNSWGREPNAGRQGLIDLTTQAISDARERLSPIGNLQSHLYYILRDIDIAGNHHGEAFWPVDNACWMHSGAANIRALSNDEIKFVVAHEIGHCFIMENVPNYRNIYDASTDIWMDESVAEFFASHIYPTFNFEHQKIYISDKSISTQKYRAYTFFQYYNTLNGIESIIPLLTDLVEVSPGAPRLDYIRDNNLDAIFNEFVFNLMQGNVADIGGGFLPASRQMDLSVPTDLPEDEDYVVLDNIENQLANYFLINIPPGYDATLLPIEREDIHAFIKEDFTESSFDICPFNNTYMIEGNCNEVKTVLLSLSHFTNNDVLDDIRFYYELEGKTNCDEVEGGNSLNPQSIYNFDLRMEGEVAARFSGNNTGNYNFSLLINSTDGSICIDEESLILNALTPSNHEEDFQFFVQFPNGSNRRYFLDEDDGPVVQVLNTNNTLSNEAFNILKEERFEDFRLNAETEEVDDHPVFGSQILYYGEYNDEEFEFTISNGHNTISIEPYHVGLFCGLFQDRIENRTRVITEFESEFLHIQISNIEPYQKTIDATAYQVSELPLQPNIQAIEEAGESFAEMGEEITNIMQQMQTVEPGSMEYMELYFNQMRLSNNIAAITQGRNDWVVAEGEVDSWLAQYSSLVAQQEACENMVCPPSGPTYCAEKEQCFEFAGRMEMEFSNTMRNALQAIPGGF